MEYVFYVNPTAGKGKRQKEIISEVNKYFSDKADKFRIHITKFAGDAKADAEKTAQSGEKVRMFACGGEGTVFEVVNGVYGYDNVEVGVIPCGSANDFLKFFESRDSFLDIDSQINGRTFAMDMIKADDRYCLNGCSVGMDAMVARDMKIFKRWPLVSGSMAYTLAIVKIFLGKLGISINISVDGEPFKKAECLFAVLANAPYYGGGYKGAPDAVPNDQSLDFTLVDKISKTKILKFLPLYKKGDHKNLDCCTVRRCRSIEFTSDKPIAVNLDGEIVESKNMRFELVEKAINFLVPRGVFEKVLTNV